MAGHELLGSRGHEDEIAAVMVPERGNQRVQSDWPLTGGAEWFANRPIYKAGRQKKAQEFQFAIVP